VIYVKQRYMIKYINLKFLWNLNLSYNTKDRSLCTFCEEFLFLTDRLITFIFYDSEVL
jgi:hypothetical protein